MKLGLRWVAVLPAALLLAALASFPLHWVLYQTLTGSGLIEPYPEVPERVLLPLVSAIAFIWGGARIAPCYKVETAVVLFGLWLLVLGAVGALWLSGTVIGGVQIASYGGVLTPAAGLIGALVGLYAVRHQHAGTRVTKQSA